MEEYKQIIVIRTDIKMGTGKKCVQACHASVSASDETRTKFKRIWKKWKSMGQKKVVVKVQTYNELMEIYHKVKEKKIPHYLIQDAGLTQLPPGTVTALGIGPFDSKLLDEITGNLKLL
ncbi:MAG: peptidyl-tRNA hydrolase Pth2 [Promethearchaeia archaeon]